LAKKKKHKQSVVWFAVSKKKGKQSRISQLRKGLNIKNDFLPSIANDKNTCP
jgi:hypothetical protein